MDDEPIDDDDPDVEKDLEEEVVCNEEISDADDDRLEEDELCDDVVDIGDALCEEGLLAVAEEDEDVRDGLFDSDDALADEREGLVRPPELVTEVAEAVLAGLVVDVGCEDDTGLIEEDAGVEEDVVTTEDVREEEGLDDKELPDVP